MNTQVYLPCIQNPLAIFSFLNGMKCYCLLKAINFRSPPARTLKAVQFNNYYLQNWERAKKYFLPSTDFCMNGLCRLGSLHEFILGTTLRSFRSGGNLHYFITFLKSISDPVSIGISRSKNILLFHQTFALKARLKG